MQTLANLLHILFFPDVEIHVSDEEKDELRQCS